jgi:hypothetical protein
MGLGQSLGHCAPLRPSSSLAFSNYLDRRRSRNFGGEVEPPPYHVKVAVASKNGGIPANSRHHKRDGLLRNRAVRAVGAGVLAGEIAVGVVAIAWVLRAVDRARDRLHRVRQRVAGMGIAVRPRAAIRVHKIRLAGDVADVVIGDRLQDPDPRPARRPVHAGLRQPVQRVVAELLARGISVRAARQVADRVERSGQVRHRAVVMTGVAATSS